MTVTILSTRGFPSHRLGHSHGGRRVLDNDSRLKGRPLLGTSRPVMAAISCFPRLGDTLCLEGQSLSRRRAFELGYRVSLLSSTNYDLLRAAGFRQELGPEDQVSCIFQHQAVVGGEIRFTLTTIDNQNVNYRILRRAEFRRCGNLLTIPTIPAALILSKIAPRSS